MFTQPNTTQKPIFYSYCWANSWVYPQPDFFLWSSLISMNKVKKTRPREINFEPTAILSMKLIGTKSMLRFYAANRSSKVNCMQWRQKDGEKSIITRYCFTNNLDGQYRTIHIRIMLQHVPWQATFSDLLKEIDLIMQQWPWLQN